MASYNQSTMLGNLTRDPELKYLQSGVPVCNFGLATNRKFKDKTTGEDREITCFIDIEAWNRTAEVASEYLTKGSQVMIVGELIYDTWETDDGEKRGKHKIRAERLVFTGSGGEGGVESKGNADSNAGQQTQPVQQQGGTTASSPKEDDDIPF